MFDLSDITELLIDNAKKLFFPDGWINIDLKFSKTEIFTLLLLDRNKQVTMTELSEYINSPMSTATGITDRLVKGGYVNRERSETDRRVVVIELTDKGSAFIEDFKSLISKYFNIILEDLSQEEKQFLAKTVLKIIDRLQARAADKAPDDKERTTVKKIDIQ